MATVSLDNKDKVKQLYLEYADKLFSYACGLLKSPAEAEDVIQEFFMDLIRNLDSKRDAREILYHAECRVYILRRTHTFLSSGNSNVSIQHNT